MIVIMCHGFGSDKDEVGGMFTRIAEALAEEDIASLRYDQRGHGESTCPIASRTYTKQIKDLKFICHKARENGYKDIILLGFSLGAKVIGDLLTEEQDFKMVIMWSGAAENGIGSLRGKHDYKIEDEKIIYYFDFRQPLILSRRWLDELSESRALDGYNSYNGDILAIVGSQDKIVSPDVPSHIKNKVRVICCDSDHIFDALKRDDIVTYVIDVTVKEIIEHKNSKF